MQSQVDYVAKRHTQDVSDIIDKDVDKIIRKVNNDMYKEAITMYDSFVQQFYLYETTSYIRHWEGRPGTEQGQNLYFGKDIRKISRKPKLIIYLPKDSGYVPNGGGQMSGPMEDDYRFNTAEEVLNYVFGGIRFPKNIKQGEKSWTLKSNLMWSGSYNGEYFSCQNVTMRQAFEIFNNNFDTIAAKSAKYHLKQMGY